MVCASQEEKYRFPNSCKPSPRSSVSAVAISTSEPRLNAVVCEHRVLLLADSRAQVGGTQDKPGRSPCAGGREDGILSKECKSQLGGAPSD